MTEQANGKSAAPNAAEMADNFIGCACTAILNGIFKSLAMMPLDMVLVMTCTILGRLVGQSLSVGDVAFLLNTRRKCAAAFEAEMKKIAVQAPLPPGSQQHGPVTRETEDLLRKLKNQPN